MKLQNPVAQVCTQGAGCPLRPFRCFAQSTSRDPPHPLTASGYDFIKARCRRSDEWEWHAAVHVLDAVVERAGTVMKALGRRRQPANVLMVSWDSTSALNFQRQAPRSLKLLQQRLHATIMNGCSVPPAV